MLFVKNISCTCHIDALPEVEVCEARAVEERHGEAGVLHGGALGHVQVGEGGRGRGGAGPIGVLSCDERPIDIDEAISIILGRLLGSGQ